MSSYERPIFELTDNLSSHTSVSNVEEISNDAHEQESLDILDKNSFFQALNVALEDSVELRSKDGGVVKYVDMKSLFRPADKPSLVSNAPSFPYGVNIACGRRAMTFVIVDNLHLLEENENRRVEKVLKLSYHDPKGCSRPVQRLSISSDGLILKTATSTTQLNDLAFTFDPELTQRVKGFQEEENNDSVENLCQRNSASLLMSCDTIALGTKKSLIPVTLKVFDKEGDTKERASCLIPLVSPGCVSYYTHRFENLENSGKKRTKVVYLADIFVACFDQDQFHDRLRYYNWVHRLWNPVSAVVENNFEFQGQGYESELAEWLENEGLSPFIDGPLSHGYQIPVLNSDIFGLERISKKARLFVWESIKRALRVQLEAEILIPFCNFLNGPGTSFMNAMEILSYGTNRFLERHYSVNMIQGENEESLNFEKSQKVKSSILNEKLLSTECIAAISNTPISAFGSLNTRRILNLPNLIKRDISIIATHVFEEAFLLQKAHFYAIEKLSEKYTSEIEKRMLQMSGETREEVIQGIASLHNEEMENWELEGLKVARVKKVDKGKKGNINDDPPNMPLFSEKNSTKKVSRHFLGRVFTYNSDDDLKKNTFDGKFKLLHSIERLLINARRIMRGETHSVKDKLFRSKLERRNMMAFYMRRLEKFAGQKEMNVYKFTAELSMRLLLVVEIDMNSASLGDKTQYNRSSIEIDALSRLSIPPVFDLDPALIQPPDDKAFLTLARAPSFLKREYHRTSSNLPSVTLSTDDFLYSEIEKKNVTTRENQLERATEKWASQAILRASFVFLERELRLVIRNENEPVDFFDKKCDEAAERALIKLKKRYDDLDEDDIVIITDDFGNLQLEGHQSYHHSSYLGNVSGKKSGGLQRSAIYAFDVNKSKSSKGNRLNHLDKHPHVSGLFKKLRNQDYSGKQGKGWYNNMSRYLEAWKNSNGDPTSPEISKIEVEINLTLEELVLRHEEWMSCYLEAEKLFEYEELISAVISSNKNTVTWEETKLKLMERLVADHLDFQIMDKSERQRHAESLANQEIAPYLSDLEAFFLNEKESNKLNQTRENINANAEEKKKATRKFAMPPIGAFHNGQTFIISIVTKLNAFENSENISKIRNPFIVQIKHSEVEESKSEGRASSLLLINGTEQFGKCEIYIDESNCPFMKPLLKRLPLTRPVSTLIGIGKSGKCVSALTGTELRKYQRSSIAKDLDGSSPALHAHQADFILRTLKRILMRKLIVPLKMGAKTVLLNFKEEQAYEESIESERAKDRTCFGIAGGALKQDRTSVSSYIPLIGKTDEETREEESKERLSNIGDNGFIEVCLMKFTFHQLCQKFPQCLRHTHAIDTNGILSVAVLEVNNTFSLSSSRSKEKKIDFLMEERKPKVRFFIKNKETEERIGKIYDTAPASHGGSLYGAWPKRDCTSDFLLPFEGYAVGKTVLDLEVFYWKKTVLNDEIDNYQSAGKVEIPIEKICPLSFLPVDRWYELSLNSANVRKSQCWQIRLQLSVFDVNYLSEKCIVPSVLPSFAYESKKTKIMKTRSDGSEWWRRAGLHSVQKMQESVETLAPLAWDHKSHEIANDSFCDELEAWFVFQRKPVSLQEARLTIAARRREGKNVSKEEVEKLKFVKEEKKEEDERREIETKVRPGFVPHQSKEVERNAKKDDSDDDNCKGKNTDNEERGDVGEEEEDGKINVKFITKKDLKKENIIFNLEKMETSLERKARLNKERDTRIKARIYALEKKTKQIFD
eukprot:g5244.t1